MNLSAEFTENLEKLREQLKTDKGKKIALLILLVAFVVIVLMFGGKDTKKEESQPQVNNTSLSYEGSLETRLESLISQVDGVGSCQVMVTLEKDNYKILARDSYEDESGNKYEYVTIETEAGNDDGLVVNSIMPQVRGVAIVCEGADSNVVKAEIITLVSSVLSVNTTQVSVTKMK